MSDQAAGEDLVSVQEAAEIAGVSKEKVLQWMNSDVLPLQGAGSERGGRFIPRQALLALLEREGMDRQTG